MYGTLVQKVRDSDPKWAASGGWGEIITQASNDVAQLTGNDSRKAERKWPVILM
jgi:hypothetical protein